MMQHTSERAELMTAPRVVETRALARAPVSGEARQRFAELHQANRLRQVEVEPR